MPQKFADYQASFPKNAKMKGLTILLHGAPGTGKTQLVLNLSKLTKRPIMKIDITMVLDKWVGNSEKNLLNIFQNHKTACERMEVAPILFLNECDQILGKRIGIRNSVDSMNNALQNILLEQMEQFDGIMIGRASIGYPWIFNEIKHFMETGEHLSTPSIKDRVEATREHLKQSIYWKGEILGIVEMKRHYTNYFKGIAHFKELKSKLVTSMEYQEIQDTLDYITTNENEFHFA
jgi:SpoVK/Ycf46/Vps4 family AAA+-type ATPase